MSASLTRTKLESGGDHISGPQTQRVGKANQQNRGHTPASNQVRGGPLPRAPQTVRTSSTAAASTRRSKLNNNFMSNQNAHPNATLGTAS